MDTTGLLAGIARGLRAGAGVLSPEVFANNERERQMRMLRSDQMKDNIFALISEGIQSGSIEPDKGMEALRRLNPQMAEQMASLSMGPSRAAQQAALEQQMKIAEYAQQQELLNQKKQWASENQVPLFAVDAAVQSQYATTTPTEVERLIAARDRALKSGNTEAAELINARLNKLSTHQPLVSISNKEETEFGKKFGSMMAERAGGYIESGSTAASMEQSLAQLNDLLSGTPTGAIQPALTTLQGIAADLGIDLGSVAQRTGVELGNLKNKEEFDRLSTNLVIDGFSKFKGNLNPQETRLAINAFPSLGRSEEGNRLAIASLLASARIAQERAARAAQISSPAEMRQFEAEVQRAGTKEFEEKRKEILASMPKSKQGRGALKVGERITRGGRSYRVVGFDTDGEPLVEPE